MYARGSFPHLNPFAPKLDERGFPLCVSAVYYLPSQRFKAAWARAFRAAIAAHRALTRGGAR